MTGEKIVKQAEKYKGESGSKFCKSYGFDYVVDWCCIFVWYVFKQCKTTGLFPKCAYVPTADSWLRKNAKFIKNYKNAKPGDIIIFTWDGNGYNSRTGRRQHIGIVVEWKNGKMHTIEGNTGSENCKKSKVNYRERSASYIYGIYRPKYQADKKEDKESFESKVKKILSGKYKNPEKELGDDYQKVKKESVRIHKLAVNTIKGKYGNGSERKTKLGSDYNMVQWYINLMIGG